MQLIDKHALLKKVYEHPQERERMTDGEWCRKCIYEAPTIEADIDHAAIMRLCNEIEMIVVTVCDTGYTLQGGDVEAIMKRTKAIRKELTGDAGTD